MKNKEIQERRIKGYFIQATKDILKGEGLRGISVRNIADQAGYSYATLYNYFKDINDLVFVCVSDFQEECQQFVFKKSKKSPRGKERIKAMALFYMYYFIEYPGIFDLFYIEKITDADTTQETRGVIGKSIDEICKTEWDYCISHGMYDPKDVEAIKGQLRHSVIGLLLLYLNRRIPDSYTEFLKHAEDQIVYILK